MRSLHFGAGKIGRGFIGAVLHKAGYDICFADINDELVALINSEGNYAVHVMDEYSYSEIIDGIRAVNSSTSECQTLFSDVDLVTTAVSMNVLPLIAPTIAKGLRCRRDSGVEEPLNIISCENGIRATSLLKGYVYNSMDEPLKKWAEGHVAFVDSAVDRIVPPIPCERPLDVVVEEFYEWCVDKNQVKGQLPKIDGMHMTDTLNAFIERKLYTVNTGHVATAFFGNLKGYTYISEALADEDLIADVRNVLKQSSDALISKFGFAPSIQYEYSETVLRRFRNPYLKDTVARVCRDPRRKMGAPLYFSYPISMAKSQNLPYDKIAYATGAGLNVYNADDPQCFEIMDLIETLGLEKAISSITGQTDPEVISCIAEAYKSLKLEKEK